MTIASRHPELRSGFTLAELIIGLLLLALIGGATAARGDVATASDPANCGCRATCQA